MRTHPALSCIVLITFSLCITAFSQRIIDLRVGLYENSPKTGTGPTGRPEGIFIDIIEAIASREGWNIRFVSGTWNEGLERLQRGEIDLMPDVAFTPDRNRLFVFHNEPVMSSFSQVYALRNNNIHSLLDLDGKRVAVLKGSIQEEQFLSMVSGFGLQITIVPCENYSEAFSAVGENRADAAVTNRHYGVKNAGPHNLVETPVIFSPTRLFFAASRHTAPDILAAIDRQLAEMKKNSHSPYYDSMRKWAAYEAPPRWPQWIIWLLGAMASITVIVIIWSLTLRRSARMLRKSEEKHLLLLDELERATKTAESADRLKSAFLATMSHELRTPLNSIIGFSGILLQGLAGPLNDEQYRQIGMVATSAEHLLALINDVLDLSKIEAGQLSLYTETFDLRTSIEKIRSSMAIQAEKKNITLSTVISGDNLELTGDQRRMEQILLNLISNAIKFTENGSVIIKAERSEAGVIQVEVTDTGLGIKDEDVPMLFRPFSQLDNGLSKRHEGTGLGLSICKRLVELMGGRIWVKTERGRGSTFGFELPASQKESA